MVDVLTDIVIRRPRDEVAQYAANADHAPEWYVNIKSAEWHTAKPLRVGTKIAFQAGFLGKRLAYVYEIVDYEPGKKLGIFQDDGTVHVVHDEKGEQQGPEETQGNPRK